ncbi:MAG TPA: hypothetical protein VGJ22_13460 [Anaerolineales bacterium]|jgi:hypothetical protein
MTRRYWMLAGQVLLLGLVLAFPLRGVMQRVVITPAAYVLWALGIFYAATPQLIWWAAIVIVVTLTALGTLAAPVRFTPRRPVEAKPVQGPVESLALWIGKTPGGIYYKWLVAHRLGKLAYQFLLQHEGHRPRTLFAPLTGADWQPGEELRAYLEVGLHGSFADYPQSPNPLKAAAPTPLDLDITEAVLFLESKMEPERDKYR